MYSLRHEKTRPEFAKVGLVREAQSKRNAPFAGFSLPGAPPLVVPRKVLRASIAGLTDAHVRVVTRAGRGPRCWVGLC